MKTVPKKTYDELVEWIDYQLHMEPGEASASYILDEVLEKLDVRVNQERRES